MTLMHMTDFAHFDPLFKAYQPKELSQTLYAAAVVVMLLQNQVGDWEVLLTKRSENLPTYPGDFSFPGGMSDSLDLNLLATAQRELLEELNIPIDAYEIIGQLDDFQDRYGQLVRPYVLKMQKADFEKLHQFSSSEITTLYYFPLTRLDEIKDDPKLHKITRRTPSYCYLDGDVFVWGLTANLLVHLGNILNKGDRPVGRLVKQSKS